MLKLNEEFYTIVDHNDNIEYDYDGPMFECVTGSDGKYIKRCLEHLRNWDRGQSNFRIIKVKLTEMS